jgi:hypothetical protein
MKKGVVAVLAAVAVLLGTADGRPRADAGSCGLPAGGPLWVDYAGHDAPIVPKPGMVLAVSSGTTVPAQMRAAGAATVFFDLHLNDRVGTTLAPADPASIPDKAKKLFDFAVQVTGCPTPVIAENELFGAQTPTPWSPTNGQYRANVLALLQQLKALGATPAVTIANPPYTGGEAADWWRQAAQAAILIRQVYFTSPGPIGLSKLGPAKSSFAMRRGMRALVSRFAAINIPANRVALELQFQSAPGQGGRQGLQPKSAWLEFVKLEALAAKQVLADTPIEGIWSWGWPSFSVAGNDPDKPAAACVYFWARDQKLCDAPTVAGVPFDQSLTEGQIMLPAGARCTFGQATISRADVGRAAALTGDLGSAATALMERVVLRADEPVDAGTVLASERAIVRDRFGGSVGRYRAALAAAHITLADARSIIADRLARDRVKERFKPMPATAQQVTDFAATYAATNVRLVSVDQPAPWLGGARRGFAVETIAPEQVFALPVGEKKPIDTLDGRFVVRALGPSLPVYALPPARARDVAQEVLGRFAKDDVYQRWLRTQEAALQNEAVCARDDIPAAGDVDLTLWAPFLAA